MKILLIGSGGREHAFAYKISESKLCDKLFIMPGNPGTAMHGTNVKGDSNDFSEVGAFCDENKIDLVIVGPEEPLVKGIRDHFSADEKLRSIGFIGPDKIGAQLEGSKDFSKAFMKKYKIPAASYKTFEKENISEGIEYVKNHSLPVVLKADGLAAGKGVLICETNEEAVAELRSMISEKKFGDASSKVVVEEFLKGIELSVFVLSDGNKYKILPSAKDYKRIGEGDTGLNTGGTGAVSPVPFAEENFMKKVEDRIIKPTIYGLKNENINYVGFIFIGLMKVGDDPFVIEYNCRMGDPETEVVLPRIKSDFVELMKACAEGKLNEYKLEVDERCAATVMLVSKGYPGEYEKEKIIFGAEACENSIVFHSGTKRNDKNELVTNGGRVMAITSFGNDLQEAVSQSIKNAKKISFEGKYFRRDIGYEFL
ncbi:MAG: phosphoribosylamine--glycine ligase [Bacteroidia bacterium]